MYRRIIVLTGALLVAVALCAGAQVEPAEDEAGDAFRGAFAPEMEPEARVQALERVAKEHPKSRWADDALWVLGEAARQQSLPVWVVRYWSLMLARYPDVELEEFTRGQPIYSTSGLPQMKALLEAEGLAYVRADPEQQEAEPADGRPGPPEPERDAGGRIWLNARPFNAIPMVAWAELGRCYEQLGKPALALEAYRKAQDAAPDGGPWRDRYADRTERMRRRVEAARAPEEAAGPGPVAGPPPEHERGEEVDSSETERPARD